MVLWRFIHSYGIVAVFWQVGHFAACIERLLSQSHKVSDLSEGIFAPTPHDPRISRYFALRYGFSG
jgi:hypothetical protein